MPSAASTALPLRPTPPKPALMPRPCRPQRRRRWPARSKRAPRSCPRAPDEQFVLTSDGTIRWTGDAVARADRRPTTCCGRGCASSPTSASPGPLARSRAGPARSVAEDAYREAARAAVRTRQGRGCHRHRARHRVPADRIARRDRARQDRRRDEGSRPAVARDAAQIRRALRRLSHLCPVAAEAGGAVRWRRCCGRRSRTMSICRRCPGAQHLAPAAAAPRSRSTKRSTATPIACSATAMRRTRGAGRYSGAARRSDPSGAGLARRLARRKAGRRVRRPRLRRDPGDDLADRLGRRGFRLDPARARLSHGEASAAAAEVRAERASGARRRPKRRRRS